jgi:four helix bundle protein
MDEKLIGRNPVLRLSLDFALEVIKYCETLHHLRKFILCDQLLKSGTSIGANIMEAQNAESKNDFIHKMKIAAKEAEETQYWLYLCYHSKEYPNCTELIKKLDSIQRLLGKIISTAKSKLKSV